MIRPIKESDINKLKIIHEKYYQSEFSFPDFFSKYLFAFIVENSFHDIICAGGVRTCAEMIAITDKECSIRDRVESLDDLLTCSIFTTKKYGYNNLNVLASDQKWLKQLMTRGFNFPVEKLVQLEL
jgi:hypothetical protein